ncbi:DNA glycosylase [Didymella exigua CBS 183.55]|uniref:DNA glycosylase n=1 Tax=Didymella exigua CBS 183.55 TaxID=1150837 RepID=A0A6A5RTP1_9PLEO|nr:DNA glycosylase [Didymella exigua CBS 183.55]KAF1928737.1 DNA glycosylase [Didymella exigua CBS 183.55]
MSLRRSARNAKVAVTEAPEASYEQVGANGSPKKLSGPPCRAVDYPAPSPESQHKLATRKKATAIVFDGHSKGRTAPKKTAALEKVAAPKKPVASRKRKAPETELESSVGIVSDMPGTARFPTPGMPSNGVDNLPTTPASKKRQHRNKADLVSRTKPVPFTLTPSGVGLIAGSENAKRAKDTDHLLDSLASLNRNRPAAPDITNAPVLTPNGSQVVVNESPSKKRKANNLPPDVGSPMKSTSTIATLLKDAEAYLIKVDMEVTGNRRLERLIAGHQCKMFNPEGLREVVDPFTALASGIIGQQVSGAAAASIRKRFTALFEDTHPAFPSPAQVLTKDLPTLRTAGLSQRKAEYITGLAEKFASGEFTAESLVSASDEELIKKLVAVRGLGRWSVEMFACFGLKRMDVFSTGDLGVQ